MRYPYYTADVFTAQSFGGNQLAVLPDARGLTSEQMLAITREFNYSESTFVLPPDDPTHTRRVRIFTPGGEVPFAGHPTVGTAFVLTLIGQVPLTGASTQVILEEGVGPVKVTVRSVSGRPTYAQLSVAKLPEVLPPLPDRERIANVVSLSPNDLLDGAFAPQGISCGLPFAFVPLKDRDAVRRARLQPALWEWTMAGRPDENIMVFALDAEGLGHNVRARCFAPGVAVPEDPATGSACAALGGYLALRDRRTDGTLRWVVEQGFEMGRPSILDVEVDKTDDVITAVRVGGAAVLMCEGSIDVPAP